MESKKKVYIRKKKLNESAVNEAQGVDKYINQCTEEITSEVLEDFTLAKKGEKGKHVDPDAIGFDMSVFGDDKELRLEYRRTIIMRTEVPLRDGKVVTFEYPVAVNVSFDENMHKKGVGGTCKHVPLYLSAYMEKCEKVSDSLYKFGRGMADDDKEWMKNPPFAVYVDLYSCVKNPEDRDKAVFDTASFKDTLSHELMHSKSTFREFTEKTSKHGQTYLSQTFAPEESDRGLDFVKYYLSPDERKSYIVGLYSSVKQKTKDYVNAGKEKPGADEVKTFIRESLSWRHYEHVKNMLKKADENEESMAKCRNAIKEFLEKHYKGEFQKQDFMEFKKMTGISSVDDFIKYMKKTMKDLELKLLKAAYKGYTDAVTEYNKR